MSKPLTIEVRDTNMMPGKRGRLSASDTGVPASRKDYKCKAEDCNQALRGDKLQDHYRKHADFDALEVVKKMSPADSVAYVRSKIRDSQKLNHTLFLLQGGYNATNLPHYSTHTLSCPEPKKLNPFERMAKKQKESDASEENEAQNPNEAEKMITQGDGDVGSNESEVQPEAGDQPSSIDERTGIENTTVEENLSRKFDDMAIYDQVKAAIQDHPVTISSEHIEAIAAQISAKMLQMTEGRSADTDSQNDDIMWIDLGNMIACRACFNHSQDENAPAKLKATGNFGMFKRDQAKYQLNWQKKKHCELPLHEWCMKKEREEKKGKAENQDNNNRAGEKVIRNALYCLKRGLGAEDFLGLNEKDLGSDIPNTATKNDSKAQYFKLRNIIFELVSDRTKIFFKNHVNHITVTLDKVTVQRTSYTVILTFFFHQGKIHIILNKLATLTTEEYDAAGTAEMLVQTLVETLGISRTRLASVLVHFVYDGVYATKAERVAGGGCLELKIKVAEILGLEVGHITGD